MKLTTVLTRTLFFVFGLILGVGLVRWSRSTEHAFLPIIFSPQDTHSLAVLPPTTPDESTPVAGVTTSESVADEEVQPDSTQIETPPTSTDQPVQSGDEGLVIHEQQAGPTVVVSSVHIDDEGGWVVVRDYVNGVGGSILGARRLLSGTVENIEVSLLRATTKNNMYLVQIYTDDGNNSFDIGSDIPVAGRKPATFLVH